jgi:hypothetical protein
MDKVLDSLVRNRAAHRCEYCLMPQSVRVLRFPIDHIIPRQHRGLTDESNLALCCGRCNYHKGPNIAGIDPNSGAVTRLFHPRLDHWHEHFRWRHEVIEGTSPVGVVTVYVLDMNNVDYLRMRMQLLQLGEFPT